MLSFSFRPSGAGGFERVEVAEPNVLTAAMHSGRPLVAVRSPLNADAATGVGPAQLAVLGVVAGVGLAKVADGVVCRVAVDVINCVRPAPVRQEPSILMRQNGMGAKSKNHAPIVVAAHPDAAGFRARPASIPTTARSIICDTIRACYLMAEQASCRVVVKRVGSEPLEGLARGGHRTHAAAPAWRVRADLEGKSEAEIDVLPSSASSSSLPCRHSGMKFDARQLAMVVYAMPVSREILAEPPRASIMSDAVFISARYDKRSVLAST